MALYEYAKFVKVLASNSGRGFQATVQLPSAKTMPSIGSYFTAYVGLGPLEAGVSVQNDPKFKDSSGAYKWHWTVASETASETSASGPMLQFGDGEIINLKVTIDETVSSPTYKKMIFQVNNQTVYKTANDYLNQSFTNARIILATDQQNYTSLPTSLPAWNTFHNQFTVSNMSYKNTANTWVAINSTNTAGGAPELFHTPRASQGYTGTTPSPADYTVTSDLANSRIYASLKA
ncbi:hypothetical protein [Paenibacillus sp. 22594]|uniref:hypothetical protein n=1 Tax=Paenibacillus sp. 22594 TaxID=3453947 RepID=UPI003F83852C